MVTGTENTSLFKRHFQKLVCLYARLQCLLHCLFLLHGRHVHSFIVMALAICACFRCVDGGYAGLFDATLNAEGGLLPSMMGNVTVLTLNLIGGGLALDLTDILAPINAIDSIINSQPLGIVLDIIGGALNAFDDGSGAAAGMAIVNDVRRLVSVVANFPRRFGGLRWMDNEMRMKMYTFWFSQLLPAMRAMTMQLAGGDTNMARMMGSIYDSSGGERARTEKRDREADALAESVVSDQSCRYDTMSRRLASGQVVADAMKTALTRPISVIGDNTAGTPAAKGPAAFNKHRMNVYRNSLCDANANAGQMPCPVSAGAAGGATMPGRVLFATETINLANPDVRNAVSEMTLNITGFEPPMPLEDSVMETTVGRQARHHARQYTAKMDAVSGLIADVVADRTPSAAIGNSVTDTARGTNEVQQMRQALGAPVGDTAPNPSVNETIKAAAEQVTDPKFYTNLSEGTGAAMQKELQYQSYNIMMLFKLIERMEKISTAYAIETSDMLNKMHRRDGLRELSVR